MSIALMTAAFKTNIPTAQKFVFVALCDSANDQGECYPSISNICLKTSLSERAVQGSLSYLVNNGFVHRDMRKGRSTIYSITSPDVWMSTQTPAADAPQQHVHPAPRAPTPAAGAPTRPAPRAPITIIEPSIEPSTPKKAPSKETDQRNKPALDEDAFRQFWEAYPKKVGKAEARKAFSKIKVGNDLLQTILSSVECSAETYLLEKREQRFIPFPATWLNKKYWEDESYDPASVPVWDR